jgi:hypothetical protein
MPESKYYASTHATGMCMCRACLQADQIPPNLAAKIEGIWLRTERRRRELEAIAKPMYSSLLYFTLWVIASYLLYTRYEPVPLIAPDIVFLLCVNYILIGCIYYGLAYGTWWIAVPAVLLYLGLYV